MDSSVVGAIGVVLGATLAVVGSVVAERLKIHGSYSQWRLDRRLDLYGEVLRAARRARDRNHAIRTGRVAVEDAPDVGLTTAIERASLLASDDAHRLMVAMNDRSFEDYQAAKYETGQQYATERPDAGHLFRWSFYDEWLKLWTDLQSAFRAELGGGPINLDIASYSELRNRSRPTDLEPREAPPRTD